MSKNAKVIADAIVDAAAIAAVTVLAVLGKVPGELAVGVVGLVAGAWAAPRLRGGGGEPPSAPPVASGLVMGLGAAGLDLLRRIGMAPVLAVVVALAAGCGGAPVTKSTIRRVREVVEASCTMTVQALRQAEEVAPEASPSTSRAPRDASPPAPTTQL